ncbi:MAG: succinylglutamate desuccinylase/aspartoacylase family protein, partial [Planctomycetia bacterium]
AAGSRCGADGLDMARSFPGRPDGSATQRAAHAATTRLATADALLDLHTGGRGLRVLPMTGYTLHPEPAILDAQRRMARAFGLPVIWGTTATLEGRSLSAARDLGVPGIYAEYGGGGGYDEAGVEAYTSGCLNVMRELGMLPGGPSAEQSVRPFVVEDPRPGSGYMQAGHPAPVDGFFRPCIELGCEVTRGDLVGTISDPLGTATCEVRAAASGLVLVLRSERSVRAGDALAVVIDHDSEGITA